MFVHLAKAKRDKKRLDLDLAFHSLMETGTTKSYFHRASGFDIVLFLVSLLFLFFSLGLNLETNLRRHQSPLH